MCTIQIGVSCCDMVYGRTVACVKRVVSNAYFAPSLMLPTSRAPWLRAMILGASDGLVSVSSLMLGVAAGSSEQSVMVLRCAHRVSTTRDQHTNHSGVAGLVGGALSMAVGEYISVSSQRDAEQADIEKERQEQAKGPEAQARELDELTEIYQARGLSYELARRVAEEV